MFKKLHSSKWQQAICLQTPFVDKNCCMFALNYGRSIIIASKWDHFKAARSCQIFATLSNVKTFSKLAKTDDVNRDAIRKSKPRTGSSAVEPNNKVQAIVDGYPNSLWKNHRKFNNLYLADEDIAEDIAKFICDGKEDVFIFEANPGPGILTKELLKYSSKIRVFEREVAFISVLKRLQEQYKATLDVVEEDITLLPKLETKAKFYDSEYIQAIIKDIQKKNWEDGIALKFVAVISSSRTINFMRYLLAKLPSLGSLFTYGRCQFFLFLTDMEYSRIMAKPKGNMSTYRDVTVLYNLFFEVESLKILPVEAFVPLVNLNKKKSPQNIYFVRLTPKSNLLDMVHSPHLLPELYFFIRHHFMKRKSYVIPTLEQWIPWCGPKFIKKGMRVFTRFGDLSPSQILQLFQQFSSLPEYEDSPFRAAVEHFFEHHHTL